MKLTQKRVSINYIPFAFLFTAAGYMILMMITGCTPFGSNYSYLYSDMYHQYYPFFLNLRKSLLSGNGILYNWDIGMGIDYLGLIAYYLASPLNWTVLLVPESWMLGYFSLLVPIRLGLASMFFAIFLNRTFHKNDLSIALFGCFYGTCAWALAYQWNIMWLDTFALLPLVALGTVSLLRDKKYILYTVTLFLSIFSNYYIGFFTCIFVLLLFICYQICCCRSFRRFFSDLARIALFSVLAIGMTAILELPAFAALQQTQSSVNKYPDTFSLNIADREKYASFVGTWQAMKDGWAAGDYNEFFHSGWMAVKAAMAGIFDGMSKAAGNMGGGLTPSFKEGLPNLYCGVGTIVMAFLFLTTRGIKLREKLCAVGLLLFFLLSFLIRQLDYIWHGFHFPNMIPYRFSFLFSFVMLYMAYRAFLLRNKFKLWQLAAAGILTLLLLSLSQNRNDLVFIAYNLIFLILYLVALVASVLRQKAPEAPSRKEIQEYLHTGILRHKWATVALCAVLAVELAFNIVNFGVEFPRTSISNYPKGTKYSQSMVAQMYELDNDELFFRNEVSHSQTLNDGALLGYHGISTFTSSANVRVTEFMQSLGYGAKNTYNRYCFEESSPISNLFLNLKYMLERDTLKNNSYFDYIHSYGTVTLLKNNAYLPLGFLAELQLANVKFIPTSTDRFDFQNQLLKVASGIPGNAWKRQYSSCLQITASGVELTRQGLNGTCSFSSTDKTGYIYYTYTADSDGLFCIDLTNLYNCKSLTVSHNGLEMYSENYSLPQMLSVCDVTKGDTVEVRFFIDRNKSGSINAQAAVLNEEVFRSAHQALSESTLNITTFESTLVEGTIACHKPGLLYTSIPQNGNWTAKIDGEDAEIVLIGGAMIALEMPEGFHTVTFEYHNAAFSLGWKISLLCLLIFAGIVIGSYTANPKRGKYEK